MENSHKKKERLTDVMQRKS